MTTALQNNGSHREVFIVRTAMSPVIRWAAAAFVAASLNPRDTLAVAPCPTSQPTRRPSQLSTQRPSRTTQRPTAALVPATLVPSFPILPNPAKRQSLGPRPRPPLCRLSPSQLSTTAAARRPCSRPPHNRRPGPRAHVSAHTCSIGAPNGGALPRAHAAASAAAVAAAIDAPAAQPQRARPPRPLARAFARAAAAAPAVAFACPHPSAHMSANP